jgi:DNA-3-methyladenine glycosylase I
VYAFMQAVGMVNDHLVTCHRHAQLAGKAASKSKTASKSKAASKSKPATKPKSTTKPRPAAKS